LAFFIAQLTRTSKARSPYELLGRSVVKDAFQPPPSLGGRAAKRFSSPG
jgi:hypothetical protein